MKAEISAGDREAVDLLGLRVDNLDAEGLKGKVLSFAKTGARKTVWYLNTDCVLLALRDREYMDILNGADLLYADGVGVVLGARLWGGELPGRMTGADFMPQFCKSFAEEGLSVYLLGAKDGVAKDAAENLRKAAPGLKVAGTHHGYFDHKDPEAVIEEINRTKPDILLVGFGAPHQEKWIYKNAHRLDVPVLWGVGGLFDFLSGRTKRGPKLLLDNGFEWLCRLMVEPGRLWRRYIIGNTKFIIYLFWYRVFGKSARGQESGGF